jgi:hypothetical protein
MSEQNRMGLIRRSAMANGPKLIMRTEDWKVISVSRKKVLCHEIRKICYL